MDIIIFSLIGIVSRLAPHLPNATAVGSLALFSGSKLGLKKASVIVLLTMLVSDSVRGFHSTMWATYGSLFCAMLLGRYFIQKNGFVRVAVVSFASSLLFYVVTNFAVWLSPQFMYPKTFAGLIECYVMAVPFFRSSLFGDFLYAAMFFGGYEIILSLTGRRALKKTL